MRFLVDRCAGRRLTDWLRAAGHEAVYSVDLGRDPGDADLLSLATNQNRILVTLDTDFSRLVYVGGQTCPGMSRLPDVRSQRRIELVAEVLARYGTELGPNVIVTIRGGRIRVTRIGKQTNS